MIWVDFPSTHHIIIIASYYLSLFCLTHCSITMPQCMWKWQVLINFNYCVPSHAMAVFCPRNCVTSPPHSRLHAPSFITCEGVMLSAAHAWLFINHCPRPVKLWLMVNAASTGHPPGAGRLSLIGGPQCTMDPVAYVASVCVRVNTMVSITGDANCVKWTHANRLVPELQHVLLFLILSTKLWALSSRCDGGAINFSWSTLRQ